MSIYQYHYVKLQSIITTSVPVRDIIFGVPDQEIIHSGSLTLFVDGQRETDSIDLFISAFDGISGSLDLTIISVQSFNNNLTLFINGHLGINNNVDLFISSIGFISNNIDLTILGPPKQEDNNISLVINGVEPKECDTCPILDSTAFIQITDELVGIYQSRIDALINQIGKNVLLEFDPEIDDCPNCQKDNIRRRSTGIYQIGGPIPFTRGRICPYCKGNGELITPVTKCIKCLIKWNPKDANNYGISVKDHRDIVRFKTFTTDVPDLIKARFAISNYDIADKIEYRVKLIKQPILVGLRESRYCISFWEVLDV